MGIPLRPWAAPPDGTGTRWSHYREFGPAKEVSSIVSLGWQGFAGWERELRILPDGCADLVWDGRSLDVVITAGAPERRWLPGTARTLGLRLRRGGAGSLLGHGLFELPAGTTRLADMWGRRAGRAEELLASSKSFEARRNELEALIAERLRNVQPDSRAIAAAHGLGTPGAKPADVAHELGISERGLRRLLRRETGCGPKQLQRILRFQRFHRRLPALARGRTSLAVVAAELGYADQSHLGRECRLLSGSSPAALVRSWARQDALAEKFQTARPGTARIGPRDNPFRNG
ncbi:helix-turn-helix domain-containing protein [Saccharopolyspora shandongensis]|uniref:helix-turn-helix domain-containing protein n=1 Tax=Saccharopolyspora shandongensis TaxID=418495 RepID=UPI0033CA2743